MSPVIAAENLTKNADALAPTVRDVPVSVPLRLPAAAGTVPC